MSMNSINIKNFHNYANENDLNSGFALPFVLFICFLITSAMFGFVLMNYYQNIQVMRYYNKKRLNLACSSALQYYVSLRDKKYSSFTFVTPDSIPVHVLTEYRGLFCKITTSAYKFRDSAKVIYFAAEKLPDNYDIYSLVISKSLRNVAYAGSNEIYGNILTSSGNFTPELIMGMRTEKALLKSGKIMSSSSIKEKLFADSLLIIHLQDNYRIPLKSALTYNNLVLTNDLLSQIKTKNIYVGGNLYLRGQIGGPSDYPDIRLFVKGKTIVEDNASSSVELEIHSDSSLYAGKNTRIKNLIGYFRGPVNIEIGSIFTKCQIYSLGNITINNSVFLYPSVIGIYTDETTKSGLNRRLSIISSKINGSVMLLSSHTGISSNQSRIILDDRSVIHGLLYSENYSEVRGQVLGLVYTNGLYYYKQPSEYYDWMIDLKINRNKLNSAFLIPIGFNKTSKLKILSSTWVY